jgi:hypothetical protein
MAAVSPIGRPIAERIARGDGWIGWAVAVPDAPAVAARLGVSPVDVRDGEPAMRAVTVRGRRL